MRRKKIQEIWKTGINVKVRLKTIKIIDIKGKEVDVVHKCNLDNYYPGKYFPGSSCCEHNSKKISCVLSVSKSRRIATEILVKVLKIMDDLNLFPCINRSMPSLLVDGHQSRLNSVFLEFINNSGHC